MALGGGKRNKVRQPAPLNAAENDAKRSAKGKYKLTTDDAVSSGPSDSRRGRTALETFEPPFQNRSTCEGHGPLAASSSTSSMDPSPATGSVRLDMLKDRHMVTQQGGFFQNARNLIFHNPSMVYVQDDHSPKALGWLEKHIMPGAEFDSSERDPPPRCHPGTRTTIIERAQQWLMDHKREKKLLWLHGPAGVGKSAIVQTLVEAESEAGRLGASLFFSRPNGRTNPKQVIPTIAYQLAVRDLSYRAYIGELMDKDPRSLNKAMSEQFRILIVEPFTRRHIRRGLETWLVALDGLDECGGEISGHDCHTQPAGRHSDRSQCEIVRLISNFALQYPMVPLIWIIASRPEPHLKAVFSNDGIKASHWEEEVPIDSEEACHDVEKFLHSEFLRISQDYPEHITNSVWPSNDHFLKIAKASSGLFAFADVATRFIDDPWVGNPIAQLDIVLSVLSKLGISPDERNPFAALDRIYTEVLCRIPPDMLKVAKKLIGSCIFLEHGHVGVRDCNFWCMCNVLDITKDVAVTALRHLHSVIRMPRVENIVASRPRFYHASFRDYLRDPSRSREYRIKKEIAATDFFMGVFRFSQAMVSHGAQNDATELNSAARDFHGVPLFWPVEGQDPGLKWLCDLALWTLRQFIRGEVSSSGFKLRYHGTSILIPKIRIWEFLEVMCLRNVIGVLNPRTTDPGGFISQILNHWAPEFKQRGLLTHTTLGSLGIDPNLNEKSVKAAYDRYSKVYMQLDKMPSLDRWPEEIPVYQRILGHLSHCVRIAPQTETLVIRFKDSEPVAVCKMSDVPDGERRYTFYFMGF